MVKVLHIVSNLYQNAGQAAWLIAGLKKFPEKNWVHKVAYVNPDPTQPDRSEELKAMGIELFPLPGMRTAPFRLVWGLVKIFKKEKFTILHSHHDWNGGIETFLALVFRVPIRILYFHGCIYLFTPSLLKTTMASFARNLGKWTANHLWFPSQGNLDHWISNLPDQQKKSKVVLGGICLDSENPPPENAREVLRTTLNIPNDAVVVGHVGSFSEVKNHGVLIKIFKGFKEKVSSAQLILVGAGPLLAATQAQVKSLGLEKSVHFLGIKKNVKEILPAMDLFLFPSKAEALGLSPIEAQHAALPIVASRVPGLSEAIAPVWHPFMASPKNIPEFIEKLILIQKEKKQRPDNFLKQFKEEAAGTRLYEAYVSALKKKNVPSN